MQIAGSSNPMYQFYANAAAQRRRAAASSDDDTGQEAQSAASSYAAMQVQTQQNQNQAVDAPVQPTAETEAVGDSVNGRSGRADPYAQPGGSRSSASDMLRLLGANTEGVSAGASSNGMSSERPSFFTEVLKSYSDAGRANDRSSFNNYMLNMVQNAYGR